MESLNDPVNGCIGCSTMVRYQAAMWSGQVLKPGEAPLQGGQQRRSQEARASHALSRGWPEHHVGALVTLHQTSHLNSYIHPTTTRQPQLVSTQCRWK